LTATMLLWKIELVNTKTQKILIQYFTNRSMVCGK
jgi:hypothetical protein